MKQTPPQLSRPHTLKPIYLLMGSETLLIQEALKSLRKAAKAQGFEEQQRFDLQQDSALDQLQFELSNPSLFSPKQYFEVQCHKSLPTALTALLTDYCQHASADQVLVVCCDKCTPAQQKSRWFRTIDQHGIHCTFWPIDQQQFPQWLQQRLQQARLTLEPDALQRLISLTEGNLLAAQQAVQKLQLSDHQTITAEHIDESLQDSSHYDAFALIDQWLVGNQNKAWHLLQKLRAEKAEPILILGALTHTVRNLIQLQQAPNTPLPQRFKQCGIWQKKQAVYQTALKHFSLPRCYQSLDQLAICDRSAKGIGNGSTDIWGQLQALLLN